MRKKLKSKIKKERERERENKLRAIAIKQLIKLVKKKTKGTGLTH